MRCRYARRRRDAASSDRYCRLRTGFLIAVRLACARAEPAERIAATAHCLFPRKVTALLPNEEPVSTLATWQSSLNEGVEAGIAPELAVGTTSATIPALTGVEALHRLSETRSDMTSPQVVAGGSTGVWLAALTLPQDEVPHHSPPVTTLFAGADTALYLATAGTQPIWVGGARKLGKRRLPEGYCELVAPGLQPGTPPSWETFAFRVLDATGQGQSARSSDRWLSWLALGLVLIMIVGAFLQ
jgi:hypothetical protein